MQPRCSHRCHQTAPRRGLPAGPVCHDVRWTDREPTLVRAAGSGPSMTLDLNSIQALIENARAEMHSDTATLLLLDATGTVLEPAASSGLGRRWRGATHVRVGSGFAGRVAAQGGPVILDQVDEPSVVEPDPSWDAGVRRLLGVPVYGPDGLLGVLHIGSLSERSFGSFPTWPRMERFSAGFGQRLSEQRKNDVHLAALVLQQSLLPAAPPSIEGLDLAVRYLPADGDLGGDRYVKHLRTPQREGRPRHGRRRRPRPSIRSCHGTSAQRASRICARA